MKTQVILHALILLTAGFAPALAADEPSPAAKVEVDTSKAPEMEAYGKTVKPLAEEWYPKIAELLPSEGYTPPTEVVIAFDPDYDGVAAASGNRIVCSPRWFTKHPEDLGAIVHELVHVVQRYRRHRPPGWLTEGIADQIRFFHYEPVANRPSPRPEDARHDASYRVSAAFLDWAQKTYDPGLVVKLNAACREGRYHVDLWKELTGKTLNELAHEWPESLRTAGEGKGEGQKPESKPTQPSDSEDKR